LIKFKKEIKFGLTLLSLIWSIYIIDFYLLPRQSIEEIVLKSKSMSVKNGMKYMEKGKVSIGGNYLLRDGIRFSTEDFFYPELIDTKLKITYTPIFKSVIDLDLNQKKFKEILSNDFNGVPGIFHWLTFLILLGSTIMLYVLEVDNDRLMKILIANGCFLCLSCYLWILYK
jgi:hypothetical protein